MKIRDSVWNLGFFVRETQTEMEGSLFAGDNSLYYGHPEMGMQGKKQILVRTLVHSTERDLTIVRTNRQKLNCRNDSNGIGIHSLLQLLEYFKGRTGKTKSGLYLPYRVRSIHTCPVFFSNPQS
ncbi:hypothetical protein SAMN05444955_102228 [Lihuaxuella thermophila]|uniref:Uncharacterized protein n=1 Tax=Lihuaxuella thermophila TaxID=1173111 RepID=A0A1H8BL34_9BACL|nr:hypothetical protein SAMN05444955_102228 [Lihuaxuella thermophila]